MLIDAADVCCGWAALPLAGGTGGRLEGGGGAGAGVAGAAAAAAAGGWTAPSLCPFVDAMLR